MTAIAASEQTLIQRLKQEGAKLPQLALETTHFFADGMYARVVARPAGSVIVGRVHRREHFYIVTKGSIEVRGAGEPRRLTAGDVVVSPPGTERAVFALEDSICMTVHRTDKTDLDAIEAELVEPESLRLFDSANQLLESTQ